MSTLHYSFKNFILAETKTPVTVLKSLRLKENDESNLFNGLEVSKEFREHVGKHLVRILDESLKKRLTESSFAKQRSPRRRHNGIRLFSSSASRIRRSRPSSVGYICNHLSTYSNPNEKDLQSVSVNGEFILSKKDTIHWSQRSKATVFHYKQDSNGVLYEVK